MTSISLPGASGSFFVKSVFTCWAYVAVANPKVKINTERMSFFMLCIASVLSVICCDNRWRAPKTKRDPSAPPLSIPISCLLFGRETHASTTQSDPLLLPTRNGPCREDGALHWEYLFCGSIPETGFAIEDFQPLQVKRAIENGRRNRVRHL